MSTTGGQRAGGVAGLVAVALNIAGILPLLDAPSAYKPGRFLEWYSFIQHNPSNTAVSAWAFTLGVLVLPIYAAGLRAAWPDRGEVTAGSWLIAAGGLMNGAATLAPFVVAYHLLPACPDPAACAPTAVLALGWTLSLDALFNLLLGVGLTLVGAGLLHARSRLLGGICLLAGVLTVPVAGQVVSLSAAGWLGVAGPLWLLALAATSVSLLRRA